MLTGSPPASMISPTARHRSSRNRPATTCTPTGLGPALLIALPMATDKPGSPMNGKPIWVICARQTRA
ncbi:hypothetical protein D3C72_1924170 [compost metagenome]